MNAQQTALLNALNKHYLNELRSAVEEFVEDFAQINDNTEYMSKEDCAVRSSGAYLNDIVLFLDYVVDFKGEWNDENRDDKSFLTVIREECGWDAQWSDMEDIIAECLDEVSGSVENYIVYTQGADDE